MPTLEGSKEESRRWNIKSRTRKKEAEEARRKADGGKPKSRMRMKEAKEARRKAEGGLLKE